MTFLVMLSVSETSVTSLRLEEETAWDDNNGSLNSEEL